MRRIVCAFLSVIIVLALVACGSRMDGISDQAYEYGIAALETADDYIDGKIDGDTAKDNLSRVSILVDGCDGEHDSLVSSRIALLKFAVTAKANGTGTMDKVKEKREDLADILGK